MKKGEKYECIKDYCSAGVGEVFEVKEDGKLTLNYGWIDNESFDFTKHFKQMKTEKPIAIRVENQPQFNALIKEYERRNFKFGIFNKDYDIEFAPVIFNFDRRDVVLIFDDEIQDYTVISFEEFAEIAGIKCEVEPIIINTVGVQYRVSPDDIECMLIGGHKFTIKPDTVLKLAQALASLK